jgi:hypothetical protein
MKQVTSLTVVVVALAVLLTAGPADARGPKASLLAATECALYLDAGVADFVITTTLTNKSSGGIIAELRDGSNIQGTYKDQNVPGNVFFNLNGAVYIEDLPEDVNPELVVSATYNLCSFPENVAKAREINGTATMVYGISGGAGKDRTVANRCTDDLETEDVNEGGIKVDDATYAAIAEACGW